MFAKLLLPALLLSTTVFATPVDVSIPSIDALGIASLQGFDSFNGRDNFDGSRNVQVVQQSQSVQCQSQPVRVIQQRLAILQQFAQRIISEQVCEVETQTVVLEQLRSGLTEFHKTVVRQQVDSHQVGFDSNIAALLVSLLNSDGSLSNHDLGFLGNLIGQSTIIPSGNNWSDQTSPGSTKKAGDAAKNAAKNNKNRGNNNNNGQNKTTTTEGSSTTTASSSESTTAESSTTTAESSQETKSQ